MTLPGSMNFSGTCRLNFVCCFFFFGWFFFRSNEMTETRRRTTNKTLRLQWRQANGPRLFCLLLLLLLLFRDEDDFGRF